MYDISSLSYALNSYILITVLNALAISLVSKYSVVSDPFLRKESYTYQYIVYYYAYNIFKVMFTWSVIFEMIEFVDSLNGSNGLAVITWLRDREANFRWNKEVPTSPWGTSGARLEMLVIFWWIVMVMIDRFEWMKRSFD